MGLLNKIFGYRWSLYLIMNEKEVRYAMHENNVMRILGYVMGYFEDGDSPKAPWSIELSFKGSQRRIRLQAIHFENNGTRVSEELMKQIEALDPNWQVAASTPVFEEFTTKKKLPITNFGIENFDASSLIESMRRPAQTTFFSIMDTIFQKN
jgi:hypothetical protein